jgi:predicted nucleic acid-binding protein
MRIEKVVVNSSPLIVLFRSGQAELLPQLFKSIIVPDQVYQEIVVEGPLDEVKRMLPNTSWCSRIEVKISLKVAAWNLGEGESSVFSFASQKPEYRALVDDLAARRCARVLGIKTLGTGGLLVIAKKRGLIQSVRKRIERLRESGLYMSDSVVELLAFKAGE